MPKQTYRVFFEKRLLADRVLAATHFRDRLIGLLGHKQLDTGAGLLIEPGGSVHTIGMSFPIDIVFLDRRRFILGMRTCVLPNRGCIAPRRTCSTLELRVGTCAERGLRTGGQLSFEARHA